MGVREGGAEDGMGAGGGLMFPGLMRLSSGMYPIVQGGS